MSPLEKGWYIALLLSVSRTAFARSTNSFRSTDVAHTEMKFGIQIYHKNIFLV